jgi:hypothetical protein
MALYSVGLAAASLPLSSRGVVPALLLGLASLACGRTVLDAPVSVDVTSAAGAVGSGAAGAGGAGGGAAGVTGLAGTGGVPGIAGSGAAGTGLLTCVDGTSRCDGLDAVQVCKGGVWATQFSCPVGCTTGVCNECVPNTSSCASDDAVQVCGPAGIFLPKTPCDAACASGACVGCKEGDTRCASHEGQQTCKGGAWTPAVDCPFVCVDKACSQKSRTVFVTSQTFVGGSLGGLASAGAICGKLAAAANLPGTYLAWLSDSTGSPVSLFPEDVGPYVLVDGTTVANNWTDLTSGRLRHAINLNERGGPPPGNTLVCAAPTPVWSGTTALGALKDAAASCGGWASTSATTGHFGDAEAANGRWSDACTVGATQSPGLVCGSFQAALYCFEQ